MHASAWSKTDVGYFLIRYVDFLLYKKKIYHNDLRK